MLNPNNDLFAVISNNDVGLASDSDNIDHLKNQLYSLVDKIKQDKKIKQRCLKLLRVTTAWKRPFTKFDCIGCI